VYTIKKNTKDKSVESEGNHTQKKNLIEHDERGTEIEENRPSPVPNSIAFEYLISVIHFKSNTQYLTKKYLIGGRYRDIRDISLPVITHESTLRKCISSIVNTRLNTPYTDSGRLDYNTLISIHARDFQYTRKINQT